MKRPHFIIILALFLMPLSMFSQYIPIHVDGAFWSEIKNYGGGSAPGVTTYGVHNYRINGDTTIENKSYKIIETRNYMIIEIDSNPADTSSRVWTNRFFKPLGGIREDNQKVYFYYFGVNHADEAALTNVSPNSEHLIYDFNIAVGDTLLWRPYSWAYYPIVESIDSIQLDNGEQRKRYNFVNHANFQSIDYWVEGMRSSLGISGGILGTYGASYSTLNCFSLNDEILYNTYFHRDITCTDLSTSVNNHEFAQRIKVYPNPFSEHLSISLEGDNHQHGMLHLFSISGKKVKSILLTNQIDIDTNDLPKGMYIIQLTNKEGNSIYKHHQKAIKF